MPPLIRPGRSRNPAASPSHRACWRASLWTAAIRRRRTRTSCCAASASGSAATVSARKFSRKAPRFILPGRSIRCWVSLASRIPGPDGKPDWEKVEAFSASNPETLHQADYIAAHPLPASFAGTTYWGVHAFPATNSKGETRFIKFKIMPVGEEGRQAANEAMAKAPTSCSATSTPGLRPATSGSA